MNRRTDWLFALILRFKDPRTTCNIFPVIHYFAWWYWITGRFFFLTLLKQRRVSGLPGRDSDSLAPLTKNLIVSLCLLFSVSVISGLIIRHIPFNLAPAFSHFLKRSFKKVTAEITGEEVNRGRCYGLEVPVYMGQRLMWREPRSWWWSKESMGMVSCRLRNVTELTV